MKVVIDTNIVMAMLIRPGKPIDLLFQEELEVYAPELLFKELKNNKNIIIKKSNLTEKEIKRLFSILKKKIILINKLEFVYYKKKAEEICPDSKDIAYFALALHLKCPIWTNEKKLKEQKHIKIYTTHELIRLLNVYNYKD